MSMSEAIEGRGRGRLRRASMDRKVIREELITEAGVPRIQSGGQKGNGAYQAGLHHLTTVPFRRSRITVWKKPERTCSHRGSDRMVTRLNNMNLIWE
jgi:hypothetical protein